MEKYWSHLVCFFAGGLIVAAVDMIATPSVEETAKWQAAEELSLARERQKFNQELEMIKLAIQSGILKQ